MPETTWTVHPKETIAELAKRFPECFRVAGHERRPLAIGITKHIEALETGIDYRDPMVRQ